MTDKRTQELHRVCLEWAEANRAAGVPVAIGQPYYLVNAITATLNKIESSGTPPFGHVHRATHEQLKETAKRLQDERDAAYMRMAELEAREKQYAEDQLRLIATIRYLGGIAERKEGRKQRDDETTEQFVLGYVKRIEAENMELRDVLANTVNKLDAENLARGNVIGRIAAHLLGRQNNVTDEDVVVAAARIGGELLGANTRAKRAEDDLMAAHNAVAQMMIRQSIATGHGDTVADMVAALEPHIVALRKVVDAFKELHANAEEWECDGLGLFAQHGWWDAVDEALDALKETP